MKPDPKKWKMVVEGERKTIYTFELAEVPGIPHGYYVRVKFEDGVYYWASGETKWQPALVQTLEYAQIQAMEETSRRFARAILELQDAVIE